MTHPTPDHDIASDPDLNAAAQQLFALLDQIAARRNLTVPAMVLAFCLDDGAALSAQAITHGDPTDDQAWDQIGAMLTPGAPETATITDTKGQMH